MIVGALASQVTDGESEAQKPSDTFEVAQQVMTRRARTPGLLITGAALPFPF